MTTLRLWATYAMPSTARGGSQQVAAVAMPAEAAAHAGSVAGGRFAELSLLADLGGARKCSRAGTRLTCADRSPWLEMREVRG
jgi:hypothetical protein